MVCMWCSIGDRRAGSGRRGERRSGGGVWLGSVSKRYEVERVIGMWCI